MGINWIASFPKSGNTWMRLLLDAYLRDEPPEPNNMFGVLSDQMAFYHELDNGVPIKSIDMEQQVLARPMALLRMLYGYTGDEYVGEGDLHYPLILKTHNANIIANTVRLIPPLLTDKVVYIVRDPRNLVASYAKHFGRSVDEAIDKMSNPQHMLQGEGDREQNVMCQYTSSWSHHVSSYSGVTGVKTLIIKYEGLTRDTLAVFLKVLEWFGIDVDEARAKRAVENCELSKIRKRETEVGFKETSPHADRFFGEGKVGNWDLTPSQIKRIEGTCGDMMARVGYKLESISEAA